MEYPKNIYMSPRIAIQRLCQIMQRCHPDAINIGNNYREEKEALTAALVCYGIEKELGCQLYLQNAEYIAKDIDIQLIKFPDKDYKIETPISLQITEFVSKKESIIDVFKKKQKQGYPLVDMTLVISVRDKEGCIFDPKELSREIKEIGSRYKSVWLLSNENKDQWNYHLIQLYPDIIGYQFNVQDSFDNAKPPDFISILPKYGKYVEAEKEYVLALPDCPICGRNRLNGLV